LRKVFQRCCSGGLCSSRTDMCCSAYLFKCPRWSILRKGDGEHCLTRFSVPLFSKRTGCKFWKSLEPFAVKGENRWSCDLAIRRMRATHHSAQAHAWPTGCHDLPRVLLTAPPASASVAFPLRLCEQPLRGRKLATSSQRVPWEFSGVQTLLTLAIM